jgi:hypothetical protein
MVKEKKLKKTEQLSPRYVWMSSKETDEYVQRPESFVEEAGTSLKAAMDVCRKFGVATMAMLPFHITTLMYTGTENSLYAAAAQRKISAYFNLAKNLNQWKAWLAAHGPILAGLSVDQTWDNATATHGNLDTYYPNTVRGGMPSPSWVTRPPGASSCATAGAPPGATTASPMPRPPTSTAASSASHTA